MFLQHYIIKRIIRNYRANNSNEFLIAGESGISNSISGGESSDLTSRQKVILGLVSEDRTNASIGESLGYSESTIRQEIMRIFAKLGCSTRKQAADIYRSWNKV